MSQRFNDGFLRCRVCRAQFRLPLLASLFLKLHSLWNLCFLVLHVLALDALVKVYSSETDVLCYMAGFCLSVLIVFFVRVTFGIRYAIFAAACLAWKPVLWWSGVVMVLLCGQLVASWQFRWLLVQLS